MAPRALRLALAVSCVLTLAGPAAALRVVGTVPTEADPPVILVPVANPIVVVDLRVDSLQSLAAMKDGAGALGMNAAFAVAQTRESLGERLASAGVHDLTAQTGENLPARFEQAHRALLQQFGDRRLDDQLFLFRPVARWIETNGQGAGDGTGRDAPPEAVPLELRRADGPTLRRFLFGVVSDAELARRVEEAHWRRGVSGGAAPAGPDPSLGFDDVAGIQPSRDPGLPGPISAGAEEAQEALTRALQEAAQRGSTARAAVEGLHAELAAGTTQNPYLSQLSASGALWAAAALGALMDAHRAVRASVILQPGEPTVAVIDLNKADESTLRQAGVPEEGIRQILARRGSIETLSSVRELVGEAALQQSQRLGASWGEVQAPNLARSVLDRVDPRDPFERQSAPLTPSQLTENLGELSSSEAFQGSGENFFVNVPDLPYPLLVRVQNGRVVGMTPAPRGADGSSVAVAPDGTEVARQGPISLSLGTFLPLQPAGGNLYRVIPEGDAQRQVLEQAFQIPYLTRDLALLSLHRKSLLRENPPQGGVSDAVRRPIFEGSLVVILQEDRTIHSSATQIRVQQPDGAVISLSWAPRVVVPLQNASLFARNRDGDLPMLLTHEMAHVAMFDRWQGTFSSYRFQGRNHGTSNDRYLSGRMNAMVEGWAEAWAILMSRDGQVAQAFASTQRFKDHRGWDNGVGVGVDGNRALDGHSLLAHEYAIANAFADTLASPEWTRVDDPRAFAALLPAGATAHPGGEGGALRIADGSGRTIMELLPRDVARLRGLRAFFPVPKHILDWIQNAGRQGAALRGRAGAEVLASTRYQPLANVGHGAIGQLVNQEVPASDRQQRSAQVMSGQISPVGPWPRVGPELYVTSNIRGVPGSHLEMDLNRYDDPSYARVLGLSNSEYQAIANRRRQGAPFRSYEEARASFPARLHGVLDSWRRNYRQKWRGGP